MSVSSASPRVNVRPARLDDAPRLAALMIEELRTRFARLGPAVVTQLHRHMAASRHCLCLVAERNGKVIGYAAVLLSGKRFYREFLLRRGLWCAFLALPHVLSPASLRTAFTGLTYFRGATGDDREAELVSMVVERAVQGQGTGATLWQELVRELRRLRVAALEMATDVSNEVANRMYRKRGARFLRRERLYHDSSVNVYLYQIDPAAGDQSSP